MPRPKLGKSYRRFLFLYGSLAISVYILWCTLWKKGKKNVFLLLFSFQPIFIAKLTINQYILHESYYNEMKNIFSFYNQAVWSSGWNYMFWSLLHLSLIWSNLLELWESISSSLKWANEGACLAVLLQGFYDKMPESSQHRIWNLLIIQ